MSEVVVLAVESNKILRLTGFVGSIGSNRSFALLYRNQPIRKWTVHHHHQNPDGQVLYGAHKHTWDEESEDEWAYVPADIRVGDSNQELRDFLQECNIEVIGAIQGLML